MLCVFLVCVFIPSNSVQVRIKSTKKRTELRTELDQIWNISCVCYLRKVLMYIVLYGTLANFRFGC
jgi:hypothetical protein